MIEDLLKKVSTQWLMEVHFEWVYILYVKRNNGPLLCLSWSIQHNNIKNVLCVYN